MRIRRVFLIISTILMLNFVGCGSDSSKEAKELLNRILTLVGIPQDIVVNICQDGNSNGFCDANELQAKVTIKKGDTAESIFAKLQFQADGNYLLEHYDPTKRILMEIENNSKLDNTGQRVTLGYRPVTQELSILQSLIDNNLIEESELKRVKASTVRGLLDRVLLENIFENQTILERHNLPSQYATMRNLEYIAEGLRDINISGSLVDDLEDCENNISCQQRILTDANEQTQITEREAKLIAETNSTAGTGDGDTSLTHESNTTAPEDSNNTGGGGKSDDNDEEEEDNPYQGGGGDNPNSNKTETNAADGYIIKLSSKAVATCYNSDFSSTTGTYYSDLAVGAKGKLTFNGVVLNDHCSISVASGATIDSNNNGQYDAFDETIDFEMKSFGDYGYISPLTTLVYIKKHNGQDISSLESVVRNFDPVVAYANADGNEQVQKLLILMEGLKTTLSNESNLSEVASIDVSSVLDSGVSLENFDISSVISNLPYSELKDKSEATSKIMKRVLRIVKALDKNTIDIGSFIVNISDGGKDVISALHNSIKPSVNTTDRDAILSDNNLSTIMLKVFNDGYNPSQIFGITNYYKEVTENMGRLSAKNFTSVVFSPFDETLFVIDSHNPILISDLVSGVITFKDEINATIPIPLDAKIRMVPSRFQNDESRWNGLNCNIATDGTFGTECYAEENESEIREAFGDANEVFEVIVYKNHIQPEELNHNCGEDLYKEVGESASSSSWADILVSPEDYQDRSNDQCGEEKPFFLKKTGQTISYDENGDVNSSIKDDGFYQKGLDHNYTRDDSKDVVIDNLTGLMWQDDTNVSSVQKMWLIQANYDSCANDGNETACFDTSGDTAITYCSNLNLSGYNDWRLPTAVELQGIVYNGRVDEEPSIDTIFVNTNTTYYWASESGSSLSYYAWIVGFGDGDSFGHSKDTMDYIRCVRTN